MTKSAKTSATQKKARTKGPKSKSKRKSPAQHFDDTKLDKANLLWSVGKWKKLAKMAHDDLHHHPDRAQLALLVASALLQLDANSKAKTWIGNALIWGCEQRQLAHILVSGAHISLGRAAQLLHQPERAAEHLRTSLSFGNDSTDGSQIAESRIREQRRQLVQQRTAKTKIPTKRRDKQAAVLNLPALKRLQALNNRYKGQRIYLEVKSLPRSGLHYLRDSLQYILGSAFSFCEWYNEPGCCGTMPCALTSILEGSQGLRVRMVKSHDFSLNDPTFAPQHSIQRIVLVRDPLFILTSWWALNMLQSNASLLREHGINIEKINYLHESAILAEAHSLIARHATFPNEATLCEWLDAKKIYILGFVRKWCVPAASLGRIVPFGTGKDEIYRLLEPFRETMDDHTQWAFEAFLKEHRNTFQPRKEPFSGPSDKISNFLNDHATSFQRVAGEISEYDTTGCLAALNNFHDHSRIHKL